MNYGQAIEAMKRGGVVGRLSNASRVIRLTHIGTPLQYFEALTEGVRQPYTPSTDDQLADDWLHAGGVFAVSVRIAEAA
ncbi:protein of unknown function DUF2829 [Rhizobium phage RHph_X2_25]|nr:protein of unknown function DUF2829 [Rhizobium phage RHph_X2_25]